MELCRDRVQTYEGRPALLVERCGEVDLFDVLFCTAEFRPRSLMTLFRGMARMVSVLHSRRVIHRDLKLEQFLFDSAGNLRLIDFGLSVIAPRRPPRPTSDCSLSSSDDDEEMPCSDRVGDPVCNRKLYFEAQSAVGTKQPRPPESDSDSIGCVMNGEAMDVWNLGWILFVLANGFPPFHLVGRRCPLYMNWVTRQHAEFWQDVIGRYREFPHDARRRLKDAAFFPRGCAIADEPAMRGLCAT